tara:strand:- start:64 stop:447 length:384 start_codon:yes stop_codon:yes gene_type:complete
MKKKKKKLLFVPNKDELKSFYEISQMRSIKKTASNKNLRKKFLKDSEDILNKIILDIDKENVYLFIKTLVIYSIDYMINAHKEVYISLNNFEDIKSYHVYMTDKAKLDLAKEIIKNISWGENDWFCN